MVPVILASMVHRFHAPVGLHPLPWVHKSVVGPRGSLDVRVRATVVAYPLVAGTRGSWDRSLASVSAGSGCIACG